MKPIAEVLLDSLFPWDTTCFLCGEEARTDEYGLCTDCYDEIVFAGETSRTIEYADGLISGVMYTEKVKSAVHRMKYLDEKYLAACFAQFINVPKSWNVDVIIPVPLSIKKLNKRGYNQSELIAKAISKAIETPVDSSLLTRIKDTSTQTELTAEQRKLNVWNAFSASLSIKGARVLLIDDVCTTGSTLSECARALKTAQAKTVYAAAACLVG